MIEIHHHKECTDGVFAAAIAKMAHNGQAVKTIAQAYDEEEIAFTPNAEVYIVDFGFELEIMEKLDTCSSKLVLLDHHETTAKKLKGFTCRCGKINIDQTKCGSMLAWEHFNPGTKAPLVIEHIQDRDIWTWKNPDSEPFLRALDSEMMRYTNVDQAVSVLKKLQKPEYYQAMLATGKVLMASFDSKVQEIVSNAQEVRFMGHSVLAVECESEFKSEVGNRLALKTGSFGIIIDKSKEPVRVGLRSVDGFPVNELAESLGGGGHPCACAFKVPADQLTILIEGFKPS